MDLLSGPMINGVMMKTIMLPVTMMVELVVSMLSLSGILIVPLVYALTQMHRVKDSVFKYHNCILIC